MIDDSFSPYHFYCKECGDFCHISQMSVIDNLCHNCYDDFDWDDMTYDDEDY